MNLPTHDHAAPSPPLPQLTGAEAVSGKPDGVAWFAFGAALACAAVLLLAVGWALSRTASGIPLTRRSIGPPFLLFALSAPLQGMALIAGLLRWSRPQGKAAVAVIGCSCGVVLSAYEFL